MLTELKIKAAALVAAGDLSVSKIAQKLGIGERTLVEWRANGEFRMEVDRQVKDLREKVTVRGIGNKQRRLRTLNNLWLRSVDAIVERRRALVKQLESTADHLESDADRLEDRAENLLASLSQKRAKLSKREQKELADEAEELELRAAGRRRKAVSYRLSIPMVQTGVYRMELKSLHVGPNQYEVVPEFFIDTDAMREIRAQMEQAAVEVGDWKNKLIVEDQRDEDFISVMASILTPDELDSIEARLKAASQAKHESSSRSTADPGGHPGDPESPAEESD